MDSIVSKINKKAEKINRRVVIMEVCGTHTMTIYKSGIKKFLPKNITLLSGPGCPVCVTDDADIVRVIELAEEKNTIITSFGDFLKIPSSRGSLLDAKSRGAVVKVIYSPLEALSLAQKNPQKKIIYPGIGFETTTPLSAILIEKVIEEKITNLFVFSMQKSIIPALKILEEDKDSKIDGFILPGHVSVIIGSYAYDFMKKPAVIAGFDQKSVLVSIDKILSQIIAGSAKIENIYPAVETNGSPRAKKMTEKYFKLGSVFWRGLGEIAQSGFILRDDFSNFGAENLLSSPKREGSVLKGCLCGEVILGKVQPNECKMFAKVCSPQAPYGPCMVSHEGTCANFYKYGEANG
jgi:hydrogenase expression/formation protein HypD